METEVIVFLQDKRKSGDRTSTTVQQIADQLGRDYPRVSPETLVYNIGIAIPSLLSLGLIGFYQASDFKLSSVWPRFKDEQFA